MKEPKIIQKRIGYSNATLLVNGSNSIIVDTAVRGHLRQFKRMFGQAGLKPEDVKLIILTHTHNDHTGNLLPLVKLTGAKVMVHHNEFDNLKNGFTPIPTGQGFYTRIVTRLGKWMMPKFASPKSFTADIINKDEFSLADYGIEAKVISTPGHSAGSQSVLIGNQLISGDVFINLRNGVIFPHFAENPELLIRTWNRLYEMGIEIIYPGHGPRMNVEKTKPAFEHWKKKLGLKI